MFSRSQQSKNITAIVASTATLEQLGERHKELVKSANAHRRIRVNKHEWTQGELTDVCLAFMQGQQEDKPLHKIAQEINARFAEYLIQQDREEESDDDAPLVGPAAALNEFREGLPSTSAIEMKLMDCVALERKCKTFGAKPSTMHSEVWQHLIQAQKHREIIRTMKDTPVADAPADAPARASSPAPAPAPLSSRLGKVHRRKESENDRADFPSAKRRKLNPEQTQHGSNTNDKTFMGMQEMCEALDKLANEVEAREQDHERANQAISRSLESIRQNRQDILMLTGYIQDTQSGINICVQRIDEEVARIENILAERRAAIATATTANAAPTSDPNHYQCRECSEMFDPTVQGYWWIGPDSETGDAFYMCRECTAYTTNDESLMQEQRIDEESDHDDDQDDDDDGDDRRNYYGEYELDYDSSGWEDQPKRGDYDHEEECS